MPPIEKKLTILGSTGSIGASTLRIVDENPDKFGVTALSCGKNLDLLARQIKKYTPRYVCVQEKGDISRVKSILKSYRFDDELPEMEYGEEGTTRIATLPQADIVISAIVGAAALRPTWEAVKAGKRIALANKESIVMAGRLIIERAKRSGSRILPVDSEHSAIFQAMLGHNRSDIKRLILTASGGPFFKKSQSSLRKVGLREVLAHPNWKMGRKITVDSATLMNKALEVIEARWLFDIEPAKISVMIHPQSIIHSIVEYRDGSMIAQMGIPDMRVPISYALSYPDRLRISRASLKLEEVEKLTFSKPEEKQFPTLRYAYDALSKGDSAAVVLNAANEASVNAFLCGRISFLAIPEVIKRIYTRHKAYSFDSIDEAIRLNAEYRQKTEELIGGL